MEKRNFWDLIEERWRCGKFVCVGLDIDIEKIPIPAHVFVNGVLDIVATIVKFNETIVKATAGLAFAYKLNSAHFEVPGSRGVEAQKQTIAMIHHIVPEIPVIIDGKRGDVHDTNIKYAHALFEEMRADAITINPYFGEKALRPFLERKEKGIFVHCLSSDNGAEELQCQPVSLRRNELDEIEKLLGRATHHNGVPLYEYVAYKVAHSWNKNGNCGLVVGATRSDELREVRKIIGDSMPILSPGIGTQGATAYEAFTAGKNSRGKGLIPSSSRGIIYASSGEDFAEAARRETKKIAEEIHRARLKDSCRLYDGQASPL
jgi:orotidine-5'-phosphate decarboxylase